MQGQAGPLQSQVELAVPSWAVQHFPVGIDDPHFRLPTQPKVVDGLGGTGEEAEPHFLEVGEGGGAGVARNRTGNASGAREDGDAAEGAGLDPDADEEEKKKREAQNSTGEKN